MRIGSSPGHTDSFREGDVAWRNEELGADLGADLFERGIELAQGEIAGSAENDEVTGCHGVRGRHEIS